VHQEAVSTAENYYTHATQKAQVAMEDLEGEVRHNRIGTPDVEEDADLMP
jgi:hypothetical protein